MAVTNSAREVTTLASMPRCAKYPRTAWALNSSQAGLGARLSSAEGLQLSSISRRGKLPARACTLTGAAAAGAALTVKGSLASTVPTREPVAAVAADGVIVYLLRIGPSGVQLWLPVKPVWAPKWCSIGHWATAPVSVPSVGRMLSVRLAGTGPGLGLCAAYSSCTAVPPGTLRGRALTVPVSGCKAGAVNAIGVWDRGISWPGRSSMVAAASAVLPAAAAPLVATHSQDRLWLAPRAKAKSARAKLPSTWPLAGSSTRTRTVLWCSAALPALRRARLSVTLGPGAALAGRAWSWPVMPTPLWLLSSTRKPVLCSASGAAALAAALTRRRAL